MTINPEIWQEIEPCVFQLRSYTPEQIERLNRRPTELINAAVSAANSSTLAWQEAADENKRLRAALEEIRDHWANQYDHPRKENEMYRGPYGIGITDGHRACRIIAEKALSPLPPSERASAESLNKNSYSQNGQSGGD